MIVEPDDLMRDLLLRWLAEEGYGVAIATTTDKPGAPHPTLVIADVSGPATAATTIESLRLAYAVPIIALSARLRRGLAGSTQAARQLNVRTVLPKPFTRDELLAAVREASDDPEER